MIRLMKWIAAPAVALAFMAGPDAPQAQADDAVSIRLGSFGLRVGGHGHHGHYGGHHGGGHYGGYHHGGHYGHRSHYAPRYRSNYGSYYGGRRYHDTTHYDYHPPQLIPHRGHLDYVPGHWDLHRSGHWHH